ncbi:MAG TPA: hypothetical protein VF941_00180 [Clostridia bacterium]
MELFSCCSSYRECSDAMKCLHADDTEYKGCSYRSTLESGICFYGPNAKKDTQQKNCFDSCKENSICIEPDKECCFRAYLKPCFYSCTKDAICIVPERDCSFRSTLERGKRELELKPNRNLKLYLTCYRQYFKIGFFENNMTYPLTKSQHETLIRVFSESHIPFSTQIDSYEQLEGNIVEVKGPLNSCIVFKYESESFVIHGNYEEALNTAFAGNFHCNGWYAEKIKKALISKGIEANTQYFSEGRGSLSMEQPDTIPSEPKPSPREAAPKISKLWSDPLAGIHSKDVDSLNSEVEELVESVVIPGKKFELLDLLIKEFGVAGLNYLHKDQYVNFTSKVKVLLTEQAVKLPSRAQTDEMPNKNTEASDLNDKVQAQRPKSHEYGASTDIISLFNKGYAKSDLVKHVFYINKTVDKNFTRIDAKKIVEETLIKNLLEMKKAE